MLSLAKKILTASLFVAFLAVLFVSLRTSTQEPPIIGGLEKIRLLTPKGEEVEVAAKIDTGADYSSIDEAFARSLGFVPDASRRIVLNTEIGRQERSTLQLSFLLAGRRITSLATVADRSAFSTPMIIGRQDLQGFLVDISREFQTQPVVPSRPLPFLPDLDRTRIEKFIIIIPIMASIIVLLRLFIGLRTYGIFGPVVMALTLVHLGVFNGILIYLFLLMVGIGIHFLLLSRLKLAHIARFALTMFALVLSLAATSVVPGFFITFSGAFFPFIITTHLIEQTSRTIEEHKLLDSLLLLLTTLATAVLLAFYGLFLLGQSLTALWAILGLSLFAAIFAGYYLGLRFSEFFRFKFLKKGHVHK
ncbi:MAG: hypothetical protein HYX81_05525 [Chloroflexi bacterium]|nr:hypothetical protein [Chloroflexota bacterium]